MANSPNILILHASTPEDQKMCTELEKFSKIFFPQYKASYMLNDTAACQLMLEWANVVVVLISQDYITSPLHLALKARLFERLENKEIAIFKLIVSAALYPPNSPLAALHDAFPKPLIKEPDLDAVFVTVVSKWKADMQTVLAGLKGGQESPEDEQAETPALPPITTPEHLANSLLYLNYRSQLDALNTYRKASLNRRYHPLNLILLRGTPNCAHDLMIKTFLEFEHIDVERRFINLPDFSASAENIWALVKSTLQISGRSASPEVVGPKIVQMLQHNHLVLQLENLHIDRTNYIAAINVFWQKLYADYLIPRKEELQFCLFLFVTDKACDCEYEPKQFVPPPQLSKWQNLVGILPPISRLLPKDLEDWTDDLRRLRDDTQSRISQYFESKVNDIIPDVNHGSYVIEAIDKIIEISNLNAHKDHIYKKLEIWLEEEN